MPSGANLGAMSAEQGPLFCREKGLWEIAYLLKEFVRSELISRLLARLDAG